MDVHVVRAGIFQVLLPVNNTILSRLDVTSGDSELTSILIQPLTTSNLELRLGNRP